MAKADGRWDAAYAISAGMQFPDDFVKALAAKPEAQAFFWRIKQIKQAYHLPCVELSQKTTNPWASPEQIFTDARQPAKTAVVTIVNITFLYAL